MDEPARWSQIERIFHAALDLDAARRAEFVRTECGGDEELRHLVESLLQQDSTETDLGSSSRKRIGPYELMSKLGAGGMGEVYLARDSRLGRQVAIKILPAQFADSPERKRRFLGEARAASRLNHPNIATVHDIGTDQATDYIVMEYVPGKTLDRLIPHSGLKLGEALQYAVQIAAALECAHAAGIVHRDLKPANVMITDNGVAKVLDFGLAKLIAAGESWTALTAGTREGVILGTVAYMSPEQAEGKSLDVRSDIFSFGSLLYEMVTGRRAFARDSTASTLAAILHEDPEPVKIVAGDVPAEVAAVIARCLEKDPERRFANIGEVRSALENAQAKPAPVPRARRTNLKWPLIAIGVLTMTLIAGAVWLSWPRPAAAPALTQLTRDTGLTIDPALSPDGKLLAYASDRSGEGNLDIWVRQVAGGEPVRLTQDPANEGQPSFSPDGTKIAFHSDKDGGGIYIVSALGGSARKLVSGGQGATFSPDGTQLAYWSGDIGDIGFNNRGASRMFVVAADGGVPKPVRPDFAGAACPVWTPDGQHLLFLGNPDEKTFAGIDWWVTPLDPGPAVQTGALKVTSRENLAGPISGYPSALLTHAWYPDGISVVFNARSGDSRNLWRIGISPKTWKVTSRPERLTSSAAVEESPSVAAGPDGSIRLAFASMAENSNIWTLPLDANAAVVKGEARQLTQHSAPEFNPALSADGSKMALVSARSGSQEIWIKNLRTGSDSVLTDSRTNKYGPVFSPNSKYVAFTAHRNDGGYACYVVPAEGGAAELISENCAAISSWSKDARYVLGHTIEFRPYLIEVASHRRSDPFRGRSGRYGTGAFSPDNRWVTFNLPWEDRDCIAPFEVDKVGPESAWVSLPSNLDQWSPDGAVVYGISHMDGFRCVWGQRVDRTTKRVSGSPIPIFHAHSVRRPLFEERVSVARDRLVFDMDERTGNIWMAEWKSR